MEVQPHTILTSALYGSERSASSPGRFTPGTHRIGGWMGPRAVLDVVTKRKLPSLPLQGIEPQSFSTYPCVYTDRIPTDERKNKRRINEVKRQRAVLSFLTF
jgi:hypothetical protein